MRLAVVGSRGVKDYGFVCSHILKHFRLDEIEEIVSGRAPGADTCGAVFAVNHDIPLKEYPADWDNLTHSDAIIKIRSDGKSYDARAGFRRNKKIVDRCDWMIAFSLNGSSGTEDSIKLALAARKHLIVIRVDKILNPV